MAELLRRPSNLRTLLPIATLLASCAAPIRQYDIRDRAMTCAEANQTAFHTLRAMGFTATQVEPASVGHPGFVRATRDEKGSQHDVRVDVNCDGHNADLIASDESGLFTSVELKRGFFLAFDAVSDARAADRAAAESEATLPLAQKRKKGLQVLLHPLPGPGSRLDLGIDLGQSGILPVRVTITNATVRSFRFAADDIVLVRKDGARVAAVTLAEATTTIASHSPPEGQPALNAEAVRSRLEEHALPVGNISANQTVEGFLFFPAGDYVKGRAAFEDTESEETEGFFVEF